MDSFEIQEVHETGTVAPPIVIAVAVKKGNKSAYAVKWALDHLMSPGETLIFLHVRKRLLTIPTPMGNRVPITHVQGDAVTAYMHKVESQTNALLSPYRRLCNAQEVNTMLAVAEEDDVASAIIRQISSYGIHKLVIGSSSGNGIIRRIKGLDVPATVAKNAPNFCTVYTISKNKSISVRKATCTESKIGNPEDSSHHSNGFSDTNNSRFPRTGGTESESETSNQYYSQPLQRNQSLSNINQVRRSHSVLNSATTISNVENLKSGSISVSQTSTVAAVHGSGTGRSSISRSEGYNECNSTMSIDERESPNNSTEVPWTWTPWTWTSPWRWTSAPKIISFFLSFFTSQFRVDTPPVDELSGTLQAEPPIFSDSLRGGHENVMPPNHFICPILQEVMDDPHFAADGFTYEHSVIKAWLKNKNTSPMTNLPLSHKCLLPNHSLRSAILDWKVKSGFNKSDL